MYNINDVIFNINIDIKYIYFFIITICRFLSRQRIYTMRFICIRDTCWRWSNPAMIRRMVRLWWQNSKVHTTKVHWGKQNTLKSKKKKIIIILVLYRKKFRGKGASCAIWWRKIARNVFLKSFGRQQKYWLLLFILCGSRVLKHIMYIPTIHDKLINYFNSYYCRKNFPSKNVWKFQ